MDFRRTVEGRAAAVRRALSRGVGSSGPMIVFLASCSDII